MALKVRNLPAMFNESTKLALMMYNFVMTEFCSGVLLAMASVQGRFEQSAIYTCVLGIKLAWVVIVCQVVFFVPILHVLWNKEAMRIYITSSSEFASSEIKESGIMLSDIAEQVDSPLHNAHVIELNPKDDLLSLKKDLAMVQRKLKLVKAAFVEAENELVMVENDTTRRRSISPGYDYLGKPKPTKKKKDNHVEEKVLEGDVSLMDSVSSMDYIMGKQLQQKCNDLYRYNM